MTKFRKNANKRKPTKLKVCTWWHDVPEPEYLKTNQMVIKLKAILEIAQKKNKPILEDPEVRRILMSVGYLTQMNTEQMMNWFRKIAGNRKNPVTVEQVESFMKLAEGEKPIDDEVKKSDPVVIARKNFYGDRPKNEQNCRTAILQCFRGDMSPEMTLNILKKLDFPKDGALPITEEIIKFWYERFERKMDNLHFETCLEDLMAESATSAETNEIVKRKDVPEELFLILAASKKKIIEQLKIDATDDITFSIQIGEFMGSAHYEKMKEGFCHITRNAREGTYEDTEKGDHWDIALVDILTFLELCNEQNATIELLHLDLVKVSEESREFFEILLNHEVLGKINVVRTNYWNLVAAASDCLKATERIKCKVLCIMAGRIEYGKANEFVEVVRKSNPDWKICEINTCEKVPHFFHFWREFDSFNVHMLEDRNLLVFKKSHWQPIL